MQVKDIRPLKRALREKMKNRRRQMTPEEKDQKDQAILKRMQGLRQYERCKTLICYVSTPIEVDTRRMIVEALAGGKQVAVPRCVEGTRNMQFYRIRSFDDLEPRTFGVLEPIPGRCEELTDFAGSVCVVPALAYDLQGWRLGYGGGYYDRFLSSYTGHKIGVVYASCVVPKLFHGKYDVPVDVIVTDRYFRTVKRKSPV